MGLIDKEDKVLYGDSAYVGETYRALAPTGALSLFWDYMDETTPELEVRKVLMR